MNYEIKNSVMQPQYVQDKKSTNLETEPPLETSKLELFEFSSNSAVTSTNENLDTTDFTSNSLTQNSSIPLSKLSSSGKEVQLEEGFTHHQNSLRNTNTENNRFKLVNSFASLKETCKKIGSTSIKFINSGNIIIISKPGESQIVSLTRELAIWLLTTTFSATNTPFTVKNGTQKDDFNKMGSSDSIASSDKITPADDDIEPHLIIDDITNDSFNKFNKDSPAHLQTTINLKELEDVLLPIHPTELPNKKPIKTKKAVSYTKNKRSQSTNMPKKFTTPLHSEANIQDNPTCKLAGVNEDECLNMVLGTTPFPKYTKEQTFKILNEVVVDRGSNPFLTVLELFADGKHLTTVQADGLVLSTPTGSTAYSLAAGGSLVHPEIPAILVTPICPHTLSFRPMLLPDSIVLKVQVPLDSRNTAWVSFDGRNRIELNKGDYIQLSASNSPLPSMSRSSNKSFDWINSIQRSLNWNLRERQKEFKNSELLGDNNSGALSDELADDEL
ncbi:hypothetical protein BB561_001180 [Smittium simulii]|uniref:NAD+ kinase n=1 Tax=Smittium simulii TaxID=133385 RepID=A0A2T9YVS7_9FUNG|nr:hypothetical protein BB561_001180 [Smittium simulii]